MQTFVDDRGEIVNIWNGTPIQGVSIITSKKGTVRSNHYHKEDWHYLYVLEGSMEYWERPVDGNRDGCKVIVNKGEMIYSPSMHVHKTVFLQDTVLICLSKKPKDDNHDMIKEEY